MGRITKHLWIGFKNMFGNINTPKYWDKKIERGVNKVRRREIYCKMMKYIPEDAKTILDIGCGDGTGTEVLIENYPTVYGCDYSRKGVEMAQKKSEGGVLRYFHLDIAKHPLPVQADCILLISILEHLREPEVAKVLQECLRNCKTLIVSCPYNELDCNIAGFIPGEHQQAYDENTFWSYEEVGKVAVEDKRIIYILNGALK